MTSEGEYQLEPTVHPFVIRELQKIWKAINDLRKLVEGDGK